MTRVIKPLKLPAVTAYLIAGVLIGPYCLGALHIDGLGFTSSEAVERLSLISEVALGFIAFSIGNEFRLNDLKHTGKQAAVVGVVQAVTATLLVDVALVVLHFLMPDKITVAQAITLGAIATATAPAATLVVVRQYEAKCPLTSLLLPIVALDDAVGLVVFAVSFGIARTLTNGVVDLVSILVNPLVEILASLALGSILGSACAPLAIWAFGYGGLEGTLTLLCWLLLVFQHRSNIGRLITGTEAKLRLGKTAEEKLKEDF